jgi:hypothetical protein
MVADASHHEEMSTKKKARARFDPPIEPMTLDNMRELGVRPLFVSGSATTKRC